MKLAAIFIITVAVTATAALPVTRQHDVTWTPTLCQHEVDPRPQRDAHAAGSDVIAGNDVTVDATTTVATNATVRPVWTHFPFPYDSKLGWYTAAMISGCIVAFILCEVINRAKYAIVDCWETRREVKRLRSQILRASETTMVIVADSSSARHDDSDDHTDRRS